jgi:DNA-binding XRE family transcriptional regulator
LTFRFNRNIIKSGGGEMIPNRTRLPLAEWRKRKLKISQVEAAKLLGISKYTLSNYERGISFPDVLIIDKIEKVYDIKYDQIIFLT